MNRTLLTRLREWKTKKNRQPLTLKAAHLKVTGQGGPPDAGILISRLNREHYTVLFDPRDIFQ